MENQSAQNAARRAMSELHSFIKVGMSEKEIETEALRLLVQSGSNSWWYHGIGALVMLGSRSNKSVSYTEYCASPENLVAENDVITIDLAPTIDGLWGDYARTVFMEGGEICPEDEPSLAEHRDGLEAELALHSKLVEIAAPDMTYEEIFYALNAEIDRLGFVNLDFKKNLGHTVEIDESDRIYLEKGNTATLGGAQRAFTFEPHIARPNGKIGFKRENIYYLENGSLRCL